MPFFHRSYNEEAIASSCLNVATALWRWMIVLLQVVLTARASGSVGSLPVSRCLSLQWRLHRLHDGLSASSLLRQDRNRCQHCDCDTAYAMGTNRDKMNFRHARIYARIKNDSACFYCLVYLTERCLFGGNGIFCASISVVSVLGCFVICCNF